MRREAKYFVVSFLSDGFIVGNKFAVSNNYQRIDSLEDDYAKDGGREVV